MILQDKFSAYDLLACKRAQAIDARQVGHHGVWMSLDDAILAVDGYAWEVPYVLVASCQLIEESSLAAVLVPHQSKVQFPFFGLHVLGFRMFLILRVVASFLTVSGVALFVKDVQLIGEGILFLFSLSQLLVREGLYFYLFCISQGQHQLIVVDSQFHRITHRSILLQFHHSARDDTHVQEMLASGTLASHGSDNSTLSNRKFA